MMALWPETVLNALKMMLVLFINKQLFTGTSLGAHWLAPPVSRGELDTFHDYIVNALCAACLLAMIMQKDSQALKYCA